MNQGRGRIRYLEVGLIIAVVAVLALLLRPQADRKPDLAGVRQDLLAILGPVWGSKDSDLTMSCSADVLDVRLRLAPQTPPRKFG